MCFLDPFWPSDSTDLYGTYRMGLLQKAWRCWYKKEIWTNVRRFSSRDIPIATLQFDFHLKKVHNGFGIDSFAISKECLNQRALSLDFVCTELHNICATLWKYALEYNRDNQWSVCPCRWLPSFLFYRVGVWSKYKIRDGLVALCACGCQLGN